MKLSNSILLICFALFGILFVVTPCLVFVLTVVSTLIPKAGIFQFLFTAPLLAMVLIRDYIFSNAVAYLVLTVAAILMGIAVLLSRKSRRVKLLGALAAIAALIYPLAQGYTPAFKPASSINMNVVTPIRILDNVTRHSQINAQIRACTYSLQGWVSEKLYFEETCGNRRSYWVNDTTNSSESMSIPEVPGAVYSSTCPPLSVRDMLIDKNSSVPIEDWAAEQFAGSRTAISNATCEKLATILRYPTGPEDVVVLSSK